MNWLDKILEAQSEEEVDEIINNAIDADDAQGIEDVSHADTAITDGDVDDDPYALVYDKTDCYSQDVEVGDEDTAGTVDVDLGDTTTSVKEFALTRAEMQKFYAESVAQVVTDSSEEINRIYKEKVAAAKAWKAKKLAAMKAKQKKQARAKAVAESADVDAMLRDIFKGL